MVEIHERITVTEMKIYYHKIIIRKSMKLYRVSVSIQEQNLDKVIEETEKDLENEEKICRLITKIVNLF